MSLKREHFQKLISHHIKKYCKVLIHFSIEEDLLSDAPSALLVISPAGLRVQAGLRVSALLIQLIQNVN